MKRKIFTWLTAMTLAVATHAQVKVGDNPTTVNPSAVLEAESISKGFLPPRMTTTQRDAITSPSVGLMIYNTETKCVETYLGIGVTGTGATGWKNLCKANVDATFTSGTLNCAVANSLVGTYVASVDMTEANYKIVTVTTLTAGDYTVTTNEQNGVIFSAEGTISSVGANTQLKLIASGTPFDAGTFTYTVTLSGQTCTFNVTFANPPADLLDGAVNCQTGSPATGTYLAGVIMTSGNTKSVSVTPTSEGYCNLQTNVQNGVKFSVSATITAGQLNNVQTLSLVATGTPLSSGTYTYTISGTNVTDPCSFTVTFNCQSISTGFSASPNTSIPGISARFTLTAPSAGKFILIGSANIWKTSGSGFIVYRMLYGSTVIGNGSFLPHQAPTNLNQNLMGYGELTVSAAGSYNIDYILANGAGVTNAKLEYIFIPSACSTSGVLTTGKFDGSRTVNNTPASKNHRFTVTAPGAGRFLLFSRLNMWTNNFGNILNYELRSGSTIVAYGVQPTSNITDRWQQIKANGFFNVASGGNYNFDFIPLAGNSGATDPQLYWIFIPSTSNITSGTSAPVSVNNTPATDNHRFSLTAPSAGKFILIGSMNMWRNTNGGFGYDVKNGSTTLEQVRINSLAPEDVYQQLPFATEVNVASAGTVNIDLVPVGTFNGVRNPSLMWIFIPN